MIKKLKWWFWRLLGYTRDIVVKKDLGLRPKRLEINEWEEVISNTIRVSRKSYLKIKYVGFPNDTASGYQIRVLIDYEPIWESGTLKFTKGQKVRTQHSIESYAAERLVMVQIRNILQGGTGLGLRDNCLTLEVED